MNQLNVVHNVNIALHVSVSVGNISDKGRHTEYVVYFLYFLFQFQQGEGW